MKKWTIGIYTPETTLQMKDVEAYNPIDAIQWVATKYKVNLEHATSVRASVQV